MRLDDPAQVDQLTWSLKQADLPRASDRARINTLFNGAPPYSRQEVSENGIVVNVNYLESTRLAHDARSQLFGAFMKPGRYFTAKTDMGTRSRRQARSSIVTTEINKVMKRSLDYFECFRSKFASLVLHGIAPTAWDNADYWCPEMIGIEDAMIPARTYLTMKNTPFVALHHSYTAPQLIKLTKGPRRDEAWNMELVDKCLEWIDKETLALAGNNWPEVWSPEKLEERIKGDGGWYTSDAVPTVEVWDVYCWDDGDGKDSGWERRMILDAWSSPGTDGALTRNNDMDFGKGAWLYNPKRRKFADRLTEVVCFSFADLSAVAPFQYHSVRSLGFLLYAVCTLQNRLRCKFNESVFENLMMLLRIKTQDQVERALKVNLVNRGFLDESTQIIPAAERHQINESLVRLGMSENARLINENCQSYRAMQMTDDNSRKTRAQVMAELNATTALVQAGLMQAYEYQKHEYREIFRRFMKPNSRDPDVREFRAACLRQHVPEEMMVPEAWEQEPERIVGAGNKALELEIGQQLMAARQAFDPDPQRQILRTFTLGLTDDPALTDELVPQTQNRVTDSVHDAQLAAGTLMQGLPVALKTGYNHAEYAQTLLQGMGQIIQRLMQSGGMATQDQIAGLSNMAQHIQQHLGILAQDKESKPVVKQLGDALGKLMNQVKAFAQRLQEQAKQQQQTGNGQIDPKDLAKIKATEMAAESKRNNQAEAQAQRAAQRTLQFQREMKEREQEHNQEMQHEHARQAHALAGEKTRNLRSLSE
jgi:hypothetical protein